MNKIALQAFQESFDNTLALLENGEFDTSPAIEKMASAYDIGVDGNESVSYADLLAKLASGGTPALKGTPYAPDQVSRRRLHLGAKGGGSAMVTPNTKRPKGLAGTFFTKAIGHAHRGAKATKKYITNHPGRAAAYGAAGLAAAGGLAYGAHRLLKKDKDDDKD